MVSPTHVPFEGTLKDKKTMTGHSIATWKGLDVPFVMADFSKVKAAKYQKHPDAKCKVTGMWVAYHDAYHDNDAVERANYKGFERTQYDAGGVCKASWDLYQYHK